jgi:hypothetical protein
LRASGQDEQVQKQQLSQSLSQALQVWESVDFREAVSSLDGFRNLMCLNEVQNYLVNHQVQKIIDWSQYPLDEEGTNLQQQLTNRLEVGNYSSVDEAIADDFSGIAYTSIENSSWSFN